MTNFETVLNRLTMVENKDLVQVKISWKDGRSEIRSMTSEELLKWEKKIGLGYVKSVEVVK